ncbi:hypothetical protein V6N12_048109 [Hibiscus sabdariffa]|uniref:DUF4283 domain-containing protein n=1 Tax=Hibiscus sabdariffa TaxID=183260 RepID=A0ABR2CVD3_9ROSI
MGCVASTDSRPLVSYKGMVIDGNDPQSDNNHIDLDDDDIELCEDDVSYGFSDGIPPINFSDMVQSPEIKYYYLVKFSDLGDYLKVPNKGPWTIFGHYISVEPWSIDFQQSQVSSSRLMA